MKPNRKVISMSVALVLVLSILACGSGTSDAPQDLDALEQEVQSEVDQDVEIEEPNEVEEEPPAIVEEEPAAEPISIHILSLADPDTPGLFYSPKEGSHLVSIEVVIENLGLEPIDINPLYFSLVDDVGLVYSVELGASEDHDQIATLDLYSGERIQGWVSFTIEDGLTPSRIKYELDFWTDEIVLADIPDSFYVPDWTPANISLESPNLGDISQGDGISLTALSVVDPSPTGAFYSEIAGMHLVSVEILVRNESGSDPHGVNPLNSYLVDTLGFVYDVELGSSDLGQIDTVDIAKGEAVKGYVTFEVPDGRKPLCIHYLTDFWDDDLPLTVGLAQ